jgi:hypothetical protein
MNKINLSFILKSIIIVAITATEQCSGTQCDLSRRSCRSLSSCVSLLQRQTESEETAHSCGSKIKMLDPALGLGKIICTEKGVNRKACQHIHKYNVQCTLTPLENQEVGKCYHMKCNWKNKDTGNIRWSIPGPDYDTIHIDIDPAFEFLLFILIISMLACVACSMGDTNSALLVGFGIGSSYSSGGGNYTSSSSIG